MDKWEWEENSILYNITENTPTRDIFLAVCSEIARYFTLTEKGAKYTRSNRTLKIKGGKLLYTVSFWSSHYNTVGSWVCLDVIPNVFVIDKTDMERKGILTYLGHNKSYNVYDIDYDTFFEIIKNIENEIEQMKKIETKEGFEDFLKDNNEFQLKFINENPNNQIYYNRLK